MDDKAIVNISCACPICGKTLKFSAGGERLRGFCVCQKGPVLEIDQQQPITKTQPLKMMMLEDVEGIGRQLAKLLFEYGIRTLSDVDAISDDDLLIIPNIGPATLKCLRDAVDNARSE